ncbi:hypothetical protein PAB09_00190 [Corynebacterium sp. SCR221107]|uniref:hypothetical protein n=1 Tax=Corynebacterium sp. SCR221107 TaxID=3017361 RepID=UPI0022EC662E|nr:hypothetical protein [Corynebacterium sp. SCR221107]WBT08822.1 hypothetical protein PAB09_00190 [Corynebacterium sp. SCR221107]
MKHADHASLHLKATAPFPPELSILFGEWLYNVRAFLDGLLYELVAHDTGKNPPPNAERLQFPIFKDRTAFDAKFHPKGLSERTRTMIERMQPYHATGGHTGSGLWWIHELARIDRHRHGHALVWRIINIQLQVDSAFVDTTRTRVCDQFHALVRDNEELEIATIYPVPGAKPDSNDGVDIRWTVQFDVPEWFQDSVRSYGSWSLDDRMRDIELLLVKSLDIFKRDVFDIT